MATPGDRFRNAVDDLIDLAVLNYTRDGFLAELAFLLNAGLHQVGSLLSLARIGTDLHPLVRPPRGTQCVPVPLTEADLAPWARHGHAIIYLGAVPAPAPGNPLLLVASGVWDLGGTRFLRHSRSAWAHLDTAPPHEHAITAQVEQRAEWWLTGVLHCSGGPGQASRPAAR